ncbi:MAG: D-alanyl-D-alanine carboxypeptidase/D-alanyl-D-alanine-endopeptidase [Bacteroidota bacterium]|nr:D-alanyl-D-alanine carboxypeptidase/D-alanyl-D-alanine-endopeptidase [Candidatus Kapabacteria bacterium]MDW8219161.1 D-alanyl-D-alanine carboxypeptidase/D-alanyl-D-alanine-endopeptidase [Bacteroidota bacterium]
MLWAQSVPGMRNSQYRLKTDIPSPQSVYVERVPLSHDDSVQAIVGLQTRIREILAEHAKVLQRSKTQLGILVYSLQQNKELFSFNAALPLTPASITKLFSTFAALDKYGTEYKIETLVLTDAPELRDGVLDGNIYLVGHGDPLLNVNDLEYLAIQLYHAGVRHITGNIYGDDTFFDRVTNRRIYSGDDDEVQPTPPISALSIQRNLITVIVSAGGTVGKPVHVQTFPSCHAFEFDVKAVVAPPPKPSKKRRKALSKRSRPMLTITELYGQKGGKQRFVIQGTLAPHTTISRQFFIEHPAFVAADMFKQRIEAAGITVGGISAFKSAPPAVSELVSLQRPLLDVINIINKKSDNFCAEHVFKMLGGGKIDAINPELAAHDNHTVYAAMEELQGALRQHRITDSILSDVQIFDGSGLSRRNKVSPVAVLRLLGRVENTRFTNEFLNSLAIAGLDGTLQYRMRGTMAEYNVRAKTGTHKNVSALAGYVRTLDGERLMFSFMFNGNAVWLYKGLENKLCQLLANFSYYTPKETPAALDSTGAHEEYDMN